MGANDANLEIGYHPDTSPGVIDFAWHHGEHKIDIKRKLSLGQWEVLRRVASASIPEHRIGREIADLLGIVEAPTLALIALGRRGRELLGS